MPLIDLDSMTDEQVREEAKNWRIDPVHYEDINKLKSDINDQREMNASRHPIYEPDLGEMDAKDKGVARRDYNDILKTKNPRIKDSVDKATVSRPTPHEPKDANKRTKKAQDQLDAQDNSTDTQDTNKQDNPDKDVVTPRGTGKTVKKDETA